MWMEQMIQKQRKGLEKRTRVNKWEFLHNELIYTKYRALIPVGFNVFIINLSAFASFSLSG